MRNIALDHGTCTYGSGWKGVYDILTEHGCNVSIVKKPNPLLKTMSRRRNAPSLSWKAIAFSTLSAMAVLR